MKEKTVFKSDAFASGFTITSTSVLMRLEETVMHVMNDTRI